MKEQSVYKYISPLIIILSVAAALININKGIWSDEGFSIALASLKLPVMLYDIKNFDAHPLLYYIFLHYVLKLGHEEWLLRIPSIICMVITEIFIYKTALKIYSKRLALLVLLMLAINSSFLFNVIFIRMFSFLVLFMSLSVYYFLQVFIKNEKPAYLKTLYIVFSILGLYSNYLFIPLVIAQFIYILIYSKSALKEFLKCLMIILLFFAAWLPFLFNQIITGQGPEASLPWDLRRTLLTIGVWIFTWFSGNSLAFLKENSYYWAMAAVNLIVISCLIFSVKYKHNSVFIFNIIFIILFLFALTLKTGKPMFQERYIISITPIIVFPFVYFIHKCFKRWKPVAVSLLIIYIVCNIVSVYNYSFNPYYGRQRWKEVFTDYSQKLKSGDGIVVLDSFQYYTVAYYLKNNLNKYYIHTHLTPGHMTNFLNNINSLPDKRIWIFASGLYRNHGRNDIILETLYKTMTNKEINVYDNVRPQEEILIFLFERKPLERPNKKENHLQK